MTLEQLADALLELRRYVPDNAKVVSEFLALIGKELGTVGQLPEDLFLKLYRLGPKMAACSNPEILDGYLYGAAHEIREHAERGGDR